jgi:PTH1 family peptidyl-tRNA hydrolase
MGIGSDFAKGRQANFVLSNFSEDEIGLIPFILHRSNEIIDSFCLQGIHQTMNKYNQ